MYLLAKTMALFWTLAEGIILLCLWWGYLKVRGEKAHLTRRIVLCAVLFLLTGLWVMAGDGVLSASSLAHYSVLYRWGLWDFFCTLWVFLEGSIMILVIRIYYQLAPGTLRKERNRPAVFIWVLFPFFIFYHWAFWGTVLNHGLGAMGIYNGSVFYVRICGILWILFEWIVAVYGFKTYRHLRKMAEADP